MLYECDSVSVAAPSRALTCDDPATNASRWYVLRPRPVRQPRSERVAEKVDDFGVVRCRIYRARTDVALAGHDPQLRPFKLSSRG